MEVVRGCADQGDPEHPRAFDMLRGGRGIVLRRLRAVQEVA